MASDDDKQIQKEINLLTQTLGISPHQLSPIPSDMSEIKTDEDKGLLLRAYELARHAVEKAKQDTLYSEKPVGSYEGPPPEHVEIQVSHDKASLTEALNRKLHNSDKADPYIMAIEDAATAVGNREGQEIRDLEALDPKLRESSIVNLGAARLDELTKLVRDVETHKKLQEIQNDENALAGKLVTGLVHEIEDAAYAKAAKDHIGIRPNVTPIPRDLLIRLNPNKSI